MRPLILLMPLVMACPNNDGPDVVQTDVELPVDCFQGGAPGNEPFTVSASDAGQFALGNQFTTDGSHTFQSFALDAAFVEPPDAVELPDGTPHIQWETREPLHRRGDRAWWLGDDELLWRSDDGGSTWTPLPPEVPSLPTDYPAFGLDSAGERLVLWQPGLEDSVFTSDDGGQSWRNVAMPTDPNVPYIVADAVVSTDGTLLVSTSNPNGFQVWRSDDDGVSFVDIAPELPERQANGPDGLIRTDDDRVWIPARVVQGDVSGDVMIFSDDWATWTTGALVNDERLAISPDAMAPYTPRVHQPGNRIAWGAGISPVALQLDGFVAEMGLASSFFCVLGADTTGVTLPEFPVVPPASIEPGLIAPYRRFSTTAPAAAGRGTAWFAHQSGLFTDGGALWTDDTDFYPATDVLREPGADHAFVLLHPDEVFVLPNDYQVPVVAKIDLTTGELLGTQEVGPWQAQVTGERSVRRVIELVPSGGEAWPLVHTSNPATGIGSGYFRPDNPIDQPAVFELGFLPYDLDRRGGSLWFLQNGWLHRTGGLASWDSDCDLATTTQDCVPAGGHRLWVRDGWFYQVDGDTIVRRSIDAGTAWEAVVSGTTGVMDLWVEVRGDGGHEIWYVDSGTLWVAVPDGTGPLVQSW